MDTLLMSDNGRVLIPADLREKLGFTPKTPIRIEVKDGSLILTSRKQHMAKMRQFFDTHLPKTPPNALGQDSVDEFIAERRTEAAREDAK
jgi:bifunctional DNA-binding transcriptional regulator/antitoxin component of YhaV-PrlF toxin-antitoxin module